MLKPGMIERFQKAMPVIQQLMRDLEWVNNEYSPTNATEEERAQVKHIQRLSCRNFDEAGWRLEAMFAPSVLAQGRLVENSDGRFEIEGTNRYFTCGSSCEAYLPYDEYYEGEDDELMTWVPTTIEATNGQYYFTSRPKISMAGVLVRVRG